MAWSLPIGPVGALREDVPGAPPVNISDTATLFGMNAPNISRNCSFCGWGPEDFRGVVQGPGVNICSDCIDLCRAVLDDDKRHPWPLSTLEGIGDDVRLSITSQAGELVNDTLIRFAIRARTDASGTLPAFLYRDPYDPDEPDAPRPLRRARIAILDHGTAPEEKG